MVGDTTADCLADFRVLIGYEQLVADVGYDLVSIRENERMMARISLYDELRAKASCCGWIERVRHPEVAKFVVDQDC